MLQIQGFIDQITPSIDSISAFYKADLPELRRVIGGLLDEMAFNNYTFYTKWYTNGIRSSLPFLVNHPDAANVRTDNETFRRLIEYLHGRGVSVGAMVQIYTYERSAWGSGAIWGAWDLRSVLGGDATEILAAADHPLFRERLRALIRELVTTFPHLDYVFIEGEGHNAESLAEPLRRRLEVGGAGPGAPDELTYPDDARRDAEALGLPLDLTWSDEAIAFAAEFSRANMALIEETLDDAGWHGQRGLVYHAYQVESRYMDRVVPDENWWLLPWAYFGWDADLPQAVRRARVDAAKHHMLRWARDGHRVCYVGDCTLSRDGLEPIRDLWRFASENLQGYLAMGTPNVDLGLRWQGVTDEMVAAARRLYRDELFVR